MATTPFFDEQKGPEIRDKLNQMWSIWEEAVGSATGPRGWSPLLAIVADGARRVLQVVDWAGGEGDKPTVTGYLGASGLVPTAAQATDISSGPGPSNVLSIGTVAEGTAAATITGTSPAQVLNLTLPRGVQGYEGWSPIFAGVTDGARVVFQVVDWAGGTGTKPASGMYVGPVGFVTLIADATNIRGPGGSGSGDVTGPSASVDGNMVIFDDATGKVIADGGPIPNWSNLGGMPDVVAAGNTQEAARAVIAAIGEAPVDGKQYARKDAAWVEVTGGGSGADIVARPTNVSPASAATGIGEVPTLTGSVYGNAYGFPKASGRWQVSTGADFATTVVDSGDVAGASVSYNVPSGLLSVSTVYYWRVMYKDDQGNSSQWSVTTSFTTSSSFNDYIPVPAATPALGDAFEGGFYVDMVWNEVAQSATSTTVGTGSKVFTVPSMTGAPIVYFGQTVEMRSRSNPSNRMMGTVSGAGGTSLSINVSSVEGSGTFSDWSLMSRYRVIVAPKSSGETTLAVLGTGVNMPAGTQTLTEGYAATLAMFSAGTAAQYPAAHWARGLTIGGRNDWFVPARDQFEVIFRKLKAAVDNNTTSNTRASPGAAYANKGSFTDSSTAMGVNRNSSPAGVAYTTTVPSRTLLNPFTSGGAEALSVSLYWTSTAATAANAAWYQQTNSAGSAGTQAELLATYSYGVRAIRRSII